MIVSILTFLNFSLNLIKKLREHTSSYVTTTTIKDYYHILILCRLSKRKEKEPVCTGSSFNLILIRIYDWQML